LHVNGEKKKKTKMGEGTIELHQLGRDSVSELFLLLFPTGLHIPHPGGLVFKQKQQTPTK
jgi:hypothetical protein